VSVTLILDTSFVLAYAKGSFAAGELLETLTDDGDTAVLAAATLAEAHAAASPELLPMLRLLIATVECLAVAPLTAETAEDVGALARLVSFGNAHAAQLASAFDALVATADRRPIEPAFAEERDYIEI
jgi:hypothetical protein